MKVRVMVGFAALPILFIVLYFAPRWVLPIGISLLSLLSVQELLGAAGFVQKKRLVVYGMVMAALIPPYVYFQFPDWMDFLGLFLFVLILFLEGLFDPQNVTFEMISAVFFSSFLFPLFFCAILRIAEGENGRFLVLLPFLAAFGSDIGGYFVGTKWGKRKIMPAVSPNKTLEGACGGILNSLFFLLVYGVIVQVAFRFQVHYSLLIVYAIAGAVVAQIGDLALSFVKRGFHIKDFGTLIPGHGGILDRFDSVLFVSPFIEVLLILAPALVR